jgi:hypothetical protein
LFAPPSAQPTAYLPTALSEVNMAGTLDKMMQAHEPKTLHECAQNTKTTAEQLQAILDAGADVNETWKVQGGTWEMTAFHIAACKGNTLVADKLLEVGAKTTLHDLCAYGDADKLRAFIMSNRHNMKKLLVEEYRGITPLGYACLGGHINCVNLLCVSGADMEKKTILGAYSPEDIAVESMNPELCGVFDRVLGSRHEREADRFAPPDAEAQYRHGRDDRGRFW